ncbi:integrase [Salirhabdus euzebyi]|uniref:Integrase n=1 Tax=Salirhabdus euzebyi TaxID=394506 RepID=A0A841Q850_9BACI|nr:tyrosine-type recombinase/integrase [Salirhabdus euzebyi]MBB6454555.1 integrase [Salirhabdus euzebyi]
MGTDPSNSFITKFHEELKQNMSSFPVKVGEIEGSGPFRKRYDSYFLDNNKWSLDKIGRIKQFRNMVKNSPTIRKNIKFEFKEPALNLEVKYIFYHRLFNNRWKVTTMFQSIQNPVRRLTEFMNEYKPDKKSFLQLDIKLTEEEYVLWLQKKGIKTKRLKRRQPPHNDVEFHTSVASILRMVYEELAKMANLEQPKEWKKDIWDVRNLHAAYGIEYNKTVSEYIIDFNRIVMPGVREEVKKYFKERLLSKHKFAWGTSKNYITVLSQFFRFIHKLNPKWRDIRGLKRHHIVKYIEYLHTYITKRKGEKSNPEMSVAKALVIVEKFIYDIQRYGYKIAPKIDVKYLLFPEDIPRSKRKSIHQIDYIPEFVLKQLFKHIKGLHPDVTAVIMIAYKTGLRVSDILTLKTNCLIKLNDQFWLEADIRKSNIIGHRIPIDEHLVEVIESVLERRRDIFNPDQFLFVKTKGNKKGEPINQTYIRAHLKAYAEQNHIEDESGRPFHFRTHQFRHTFAMKMLNGGADLLTVQDMMGHSYPESTLTYVKILDETKRHVFDSVIQKGEFGI